MSGRVGEALDLRVLREQLLHALALEAGAAPVDEPHFAEAARLPELCARIIPDNAVELPDATRRVFHRLAERGLVRSEDVVFLDQQFVQAIIGKPLRKALFGAPPMTAREQEEHVRKAVALFMHGMAR